jgi:tetratricopeptide (TPR) repeat protein
MTGESMSHKPPEILPKNSIEFIPAICPNCSGELRVPNDPNQHVVKCMYCGYDIILHDLSKANLDSKIHIDRILKLAKIAENGFNYEEAYKYYSQVLENDPENILAWFGKGFSAGMLSSGTSSRIQETEEYTKKAVDISRQKGVIIDKGLSEEVSNHLETIVRNLEIYAPSKFFAEIDSSHPISINCAPMQDFVNALIISWSFKPTREKTNRLIYEASSLVKCAKQCDKWIRQYSNDKSQNISNTIIVFLRKKLTDVYFEENVRKWDSSISLYKILNPR